MIKECNNPNTGCDLNCINCEIPGYDPEDCEYCRKESEENDCEYEANFTYINGNWECCNCRRPC